MKIVVLGADGMAGHMITSYLTSRQYDVIPIRRSDLDVERSYQVEQFLSALSADFVINCIGLLVKDCANRPDRAALVNSWFPQYVAQRLHGTRTRFIHLSTDCVFDGSQGPYKESDPHTELNAYGRSKSLGEVRNDKDITMRMSIIGPELRDGTGLLHWVTKTSGVEIPGWRNALWNGITTLQLAKCIEIWMLDPRCTGVCHVVNNDVRTTKYDLLCEINNVYRLGKTVLDSAGPKPINKILVDTQQKIDWQIPDYSQQLQDLRRFNPSSHVIPAAA